MYQLKTSKVFGN